MAAKPDPYSEELKARLDTALHNSDKVALEEYLCQRSNLPGPRMNTNVVNALADEVGRLVQQPDVPIEGLENLLDEWAALPLNDAPINDPREILPATATACYGRVAVARPDWWGDETGKLYQAAGSSRWRTRELVAAALQFMLAADWPRTLALLQDWAKDNDLLVVRAAVAGIAEPPLLKEADKGRDAVAIQTVAVRHFVTMPFNVRASESGKVLLQALSFTLSVAIAAAPEPGFELLNELADNPDPAIKRMVRDNLKKNRLQKWPQQVKDLLTRVGA